MPRYIAIASLLFAITLLGYSIWVRHSIDAEFDNIAAAKARGAQMVADEKTKCRQMVRDTISEAECFARGGQYESLPDENWHCCRGDLHYGPYHSWS